MASDIAKKRAEFVKKQLGDARRGHAEELIDALVITD
jgi:hypothetical protein